MTRRSHIYQEVEHAGHSIRSLHLDDLSQVLELERRSYSFPWSEGVLRDCFRPNYRLWGLEVEGVLVGYAIVAYMVGEAHLLNLCISPSFRRTGMGRRLLRHLIAEATREQMFQVILEVRVSNEAAAGLYIDEGFQDVGLRPDYYPNGHQREDARVLTLDLRSALKGEAPC